MTVKLTLAVWLRLPLVPVTVRVKVPGEVEMVVEQFRVAEPEPPLIEAVLQVAPLGNPLTARFTVPVNPLIGATVAV